MLDEFKFVSGFCHPYVHAHEQQKSSELSEIQGRQHQTVEVEDTHTHTIMITYDEFDSCAY